MRSSDLTQKEVSAWVMVPYTLNEALQNLGNSSKVHFILFFTQAKHFWNCFLIRQLRLGHNILSSFHIKTRSRKNLTRFSEEESLHGNDGKRLNLHSLIILQLVHNKESSTKHIFRNLRNF